MPSAKLDNLLLLASLFERRALSFLKQAASFYPAALAAISNLLGISVPFEEIMAWVEKNKPILQTISGGDWRTLNAGNNIYLRTFDRYDDDGESIYVFIGKTSQPPAGIDVSEAALLQSDGQIPTLWFYRGQKKKQNLAEQTSPELAHEDWLMTALSSLFGRGKYGAFLQEVGEFVKENRTKIDKIRRHFEVSNPTVLGQGADGVAFAISSHLVLKIFRNKNAFNHAVMAMDRLHKNPELAKTEAMIYDAGELGTFENQIVYYYVIEKMVPLSNMDSNVYSSLETLIDQMRSTILNDRGSHWRKFKEYVGNPDKHSELKQEIKNGAQRLVHDMKRHYGRHITKIEDNLQDKLKSNWLESLAEELIVKYLTNRTDLHMGNIGFTGYGDFRFFDPVYNEHRSF
jgi:hypothetical protein